MLTIRNEQIAMFQADCIRAFETRMVRHIGAQYPEEFAEIANSGGEPAVRQLVRDCVARGAKYGIDTERALAGFIDLAVCFGRDFESLPEMEWARELLEDDSLAGPSKIDLLFELLPDE